MWDNIMIRLGQLLSWKLSLWVLFVAWGCGGVLAVLAGESEVRSVVDSFGQGVFHAGQMALHCVMSNLGHIVSFEAVFFRGAGAPLVSLSWGWTLDVSRNTGMRKGMLGGKWWCLPAFLERGKKI